MADTWNTNDTSQTVDITDVPGNDGKASSSAAISVLKRILSQIKTLSSRLRNIELPTALRRKVLKQYLTAAAVAIGTLVLMLIYRQISCLAGIVLSAMLVGSTITIKLDYDNGNIQENALICVSVSTLHLRKSTRVVFRTQDEEPTYDVIKSSSSHKVEGITFHIARKQPEIAGIPENEEGYQKSFRECENACRELLKEFTLSEEDIHNIVVAAYEQIPFTDYEGSSERDRLDLIVSKVSILKQRDVALIRNIAGWLISSLRENYR